MFPVWIGYRIKNFFELEKFDDFVNWFNATFKENETFEMVVRKIQKASSNPQRKYYYGVIVRLLCEYTGHSKDEIDSILKWKFLRRRDKNNIEYVPSKTALTTEECEAFHDDCRRWAAVALGVSIPLPNEVDFSNYNEGE